MSERRPHWDDALIDAVNGAVNRLKYPELWPNANLYAVIAAVEDWHEKFVMHGAFRVLAERAASAEADRDRLANQLLNEVPDSYIQMKARALTAEAAIARVREVCEQDSGVADVDGQEFTMVEVDDILRALDGERDE